MGFEPSKGKELCELAKETATTKSTKKNRRRQRKQPLVQTLFENCKEVFANGGPGLVPPPEGVERLRSILDSLKPSDVNLSPDMPYFRPTKMVITYLHLFECSKFSMGIFCLPPSSVIPLHNHPGMTVFSKILFGTMHIKSYDWTKDEHFTATNTDASANAPARLAKLKVNANFVSPCNTSILYPEAGGNMHCFTAVTACAVLDVLGPPYSDPDGRHCAYYREFAFDRFSVEGISVPENEKENYAWLEEKEKPRDLTVVGALYRGPRIEDD